MSRRLVFVVLGCSLGLFSTGCLMTGEKGVLSQKPREPATLPPSESAELSIAVADQLISTGHFPEAIQQLNQARMLNPKADVSPRLARLFARTGKMDLALTEFERAVKDHPKDAALWNDYGYFHYERGAWVDAEKSYRRALELAPDNHKIWMNLGLALGQNGKYQDALVAFEQSVKPAEARCNLAFVLGTQGKIEEARRWYQEALQIDPNLKLARVALAKLERTTPKATTTSQAKPKHQVRTTLPPQPTTYVNTPSMHKAFSYPDP